MCAPGRGNLDSEKRAKPSSRDSVSSETGKVKDGLSNVDECAEPDKKLENADKVIIYCQLNIHNQVSIFVWESSSISHLI